MVVNKPTILIYVQKPDEDLLREVCAGIEEEGVLYQVTDREGDLDGLAFEAAKDSMLGSGVAICGKDVAMQMQHVPCGRNVFELHAPGFRQCRDLGANSARAIKKMPFKVLD
jgi:hypothetical protein